MTTRAVVFDLFETLVDYDEQISRRFTEAAADLLGRRPDEFHRVWREGRPARDTGPMARYLDSVGIVGAVADRLLELRRAFSLNVLREPRSGAVDLLRELRLRGVGTGLITVCSEDVVDVWQETPFANLFDAEVFSCACGLHKPDPRIYELALGRLGVEAGDALYLGDGSNDELFGARRVGMRAVQIGSRDGWNGERIDSLEELLALV